MSEYLPGSLTERLIELRKTHGYKSQQQLVDALDGFIDKATYSRIESGATRTINNELLVKLSTLYNVSTDYILGISNFPEKTYFDIKELGLSIEAAQNLYSGKVDSRVINELLINEKFAIATKMMATYFSNSVVNLLLTQNSLLDFSYQLLAEYTDSGALPNDDDMKILKKNLKAAKLPAHQVELDRINRQLSAAVREIKQKITSEVTDISTDTETLNYEILNTVKSQVASHPDIASLPEDAKADIITNAIMKGIAVDPSISDEKLSELEPAIRGLLPALTNLWKND